MKSIKNTRKGMTLAEIMVGIALVSVMITLVVSFVFMMAERSRVNQANDAILGDIKKTEAFVEGWVNSFVGKMPFELNGDSDPAEGEDDSFTGNELVAKWGGIKHTLKLENGRLVGELVDKNTNSVRVDTLKSITFYIENKEEPADKNTDFLIICTAVYENPETEKIFTYSFCINPRIGDVYTSEPEPTPETES